MSKNDIKHFKPENMVDAFIPTSVACLCVNGERQRNRERLGENFKCSDFLLASGSSMNIYYNAGKGRNKIDVVVERR